MEEELKKALTPIWEMCLPTSIEKAKERVQQIQNEQLRLKDFVWTVPVAFIVGDTSYAYFEEAYEHATTANPLRISREFAPLTHTYGGCRVSRVLPCFFVFIFRGRVKIITTFEEVQHELAHFNNDVFAFPLLNDEDCEYLQKLMTERIQKDTMQNLLGCFVYPTDNSAFDTIQTSKKAWLDTGKGAEEYDD